MGTKLSKYGMQFLKQNEGFRNRVYLDTVGVRTVGVGISQHAWAGIGPVGTYYSTKFLDNKFNEIATKYHNGVMKFKPKNQGQYDALFSFVWNLGPGTYDTYGPNWNLPSDFDLFHNPPEITGRRNREKNLYINGSKKPIGKGSGGSTSEKNNDNGGSGSKAPDKVVEKGLDKLGKKVLSDAVKKAIKAINAIIDNIKKKLAIRQYSLSSDKLGYSVQTNKNAWFTTTELGYNDLIIKFTPKTDALLKKIKDDFTNATDKLKEATEKVTVSGDKGGKDKGGATSSSGSGSSSGGSFTKKNYDFVRRNKGKAFNIDGAYGAQCFDLVGALNKYIWHKTGKGWQANGMPAGMNAWAIPYAVDGNRPNGSKEVKYNGQKIPVGSVVFFTGGVGGYGHVAVQAEEQGYFYGQNQTPGLWGAPITKNNLSYMVNRINYFWC